ncbi:Nucleoside-diphosphate-sugar epimerase [Nocardia amikacinitolerans]|uniref:Nucleoside-diphosphate-sugar epimerase n=1 Tax=Nocardia amikacinitolerans TaxID=756689 RepID=A0A285KU94_9NOCA|nr:NAD(P)-dependent oxidoreductase [Nocardia amikacinitolerans]SNY74966.1 Nucleoside-diphosphate-sugar epimerase [Nocardia amikacinitolerans]
MRVLLAGATGAIGRPLILALVDGGHEVLAVARNLKSDETIRELGAEPITADVMDRAGLLRALRGRSADAVLHQATALKSAGRNVTDDDPTNALRRTGTANLLAAAEQLGAGRFVTQSLITGYGYVDHGDRRVTEDDPFGIEDGGYADPVIAGCRATEEQVFAADLDGISLRYGLFYGPAAFSDLFAGLLRKRVPMVPLGGGGVISWIHVADAAAATVAALERGKAGQAYNIVDDEPITWRQFLDTVAAAHGTPRAIAVPTWLLRLAVPYLGCLMSDTTLRVDNTKAKRELGWAPVYRSVAEGLGRA